MRSPRELRKNEFGNPCASNNFESEVGAFSKVVESAVCVGILFPNTPRGIIGGSEEDKSSSQKVSGTCEYSSSEESRVV